MSSHIDTVKAALRLTSDRCLRLEDRVLALRGKLPRFAMKVSPELDYVIGVQGPNCPDLNLLNASLCEFIRELVQEKERLESENKQLKEEIRKGRRRQRVGWGQ